MTTPITTFRAQLTRRHGVGWYLFVVLPGRVDDWPTTDFLTIDGRPPSIDARLRALESLGYQLADPHSTWEWLEMQDGSGGSPQHGDAAVNLAASVQVVAIP